MAKIALPYAIPRKWGPEAAQAIEDNFRRVFGSSGRLGTGGASALANALDTLDPSPGDLIVCTSTGVFALLPIVTTDQRVLTNNSDTPTWALVNLTNGVTGQLPFANIEDVAAARVLGSIAGGAIAELTLTQVLDLIGGTQGDILYRSATDWAVLAAGTVGRFLQTAGAGADPAWAPISGVNLPFAQTSHLEYVFNSAAAFANNRSQATGTVTGTTIAFPAAGSILAVGDYFQLGTAAATNSTAQCTSAATGGNKTKELSFAWDFDLSFVVLTDASAITTIRYMLGTGVNNENTDTLANNWIGFRYSTAVPDGGWVGVTYDGTQNVTATVAAIAANTRYVLRIRKVGGTVFFSVNGGTEVSTSTNVPVNNIYTHIGARVTTLANAVRSLWFSRLWCDYGS